MIQNYRNIPVILLLFLTAIISLAAAEEAPSPYPMKENVIHGDGSLGPYTVGEAFIGGTIRLAPKQQALDIEIADPTKGEITFSRPLAQGDSVTVTYAIPPEWMKREYRRPEGDFAPGMRPPDDYSAEASKTPKPFPGLRFGGSKTFDINLGSGRETALNQTLRLNISGRLSDDITLNAVISDQNVPITPEGDTRELSELDRVLIELKGKNFRVDMGDTDLENVSGQWLNYTRRLSGARAEVNLGNVDIFGSGAVSEGRHMSITIDPIEGNQGPYRLTAENGNRDIAVIPGSEKVWINGERMSRGSNFDYTVDYSTGELTFTERRIIGSDMRVVCDYEYTSESYRRTFYSGGAKGSFFGERLKIGFVAAREADDPDRPVLFDIDETMKKSLKESGDNPAAFSGLRPASGDSSGTYDMLDGILVFNPTKDGEYNATFSWVGEDNGSYSYKGGGVYEHIALAERLPGSGASYDPVALLDGPASHDLAGLTLSFDPMKSLHIEGESAGSMVDKNTLSSKDDGDNSGGAHRIAGRFSPTFGTRIPVKVTLSGRFHDRSKRFNPLDRDRSAEENRRWGLPLVLNPTDETVSEYSGGFSFPEGRFSGSGLAVSGGKIELGNSALSERTSVSGTFNLGDALKTMTEVASIEREKLALLPDERIERIRSRIDGSLLGFTSLSRFEYEQAEGVGEFTHGSAYSQVESEVATPSLFGIRGTVDYIYRKERAKRVAWTDSSRVRGGSVGIALDESFPGMLRARYSRRERSGGLQTGSTEQAILEGGYRPVSGAYSVDLSYRAGRSRETMKRRNYIYAGTGRGGYRWEDHNDDGVRDPEEFIPDEHGAYYRYEETLDSYRPVNTVAVFGKTAFTVPGRLFARFGYNGDIRFDTSFEVNERSSADASDIFLLRLSQFRKEGKTASGDSRIQEDIIAPFGDGGSVRLRLFSYASLEGEYIGGAERRGENGESIRLRLPLAEEWDMEATIAHALFSRSMTGRVSGNFEVGSYSGDATVSYYPRSSIKIGGSAGLGRDKGEITEITAAYYILKPSLTYFFAGKGRIEASYASTTVTVDKARESQLLPYVMARGRKEGANHDISVICDYRLTQRMNIVASYTGRRFADRDFEHFARTQLRALF